MKAAIPLFQEIRALPFTAAAAAAAVVATAAAAAAPSTPRSGLRKPLADISNGSVFDYRAYGTLIQYCADHRLFSTGRLFHGRIILFSIVPENFLASKLISFYSKCGRIAEARRVFDEIRHKTVFSFNAMLIAYSIHGRALQAINLFARLVASDLDLKVDAHSISTVLKCLTSLCSSPCLSHLLGRDIHAFVLRHGIGADLFVKNGLVTLYAKSGSMDLARKLFDLMSEKDIVSWNAMISGYSQRGHYEECLRLFEELEGACSGGLRPDCVTVVSVLHACSQLKDFDFGVRVHRSLEIYGIDVDIPVWNSLVAFYARCGKLELARRLFDDMSEKDEVTYGAMISGYMNLGFVHQALELFRQIRRPFLSNWNAVISGLVQNNQHADVLQLFRELQTTGLRPNSVTLSSILPTVSFFSNLLAGKQIHGYAIKSDCDQNMYVVSAMIDMYAKAGFLCSADKIFQHSSSRSVIVCTALISSYAAHGDAVAALSRFWEMLSAGMRPDPVTFTAVLSACAHAGAVDEARLVFNSVMPEYGVKPWMEQYACMVGVLSRAGLLDEALKLTEKMPEEPNAKVWGALLNGASIHGKLDLGEYAFDRLMNIEPENTGNYAVMANLYTQAGKADEAEMIREKMRKMGLGKIPGCSWVETPDGLQAFVAQDTSSAQSEELWVILDGLTELMREHCHIPGAEFDDEIIGSGDERFA